MTDPLRAGRDPDDSCSVGGLQLSEKSGETRAPSPQENAEAYKKAGEARPVRHDSHTPAALGS